MITHFGCNDETLKMVSYLMSVCMTCSSKILLVIIVGILMSGSAA